MLLIETDSHISKFETEIVYEDFYKNEKLFDFSNHPNNSKYSSGGNNLAIRKMKDETNPMSIKCFVELTSKMPTFIKKRQS